MTKIYRITHYQNLPRIIETKALWCDRKRISQGFQSVGIGHAALKERRLSWPVPLAARGTLADYVPFYFANRSPMLYAIKSKCVRDCLAEQSDIVYLVSSVEKAQLGSRKWCFTDGHAVEELTKFYESTSEMDHLDWDVIEHWRWKNTDADLDRKRRKQAEFLVHQVVPWDWIQEIGVYSSQIQDKVLEFLKKTRHCPLVEVRPRWYYN